MKNQLTLLLFTFLFVVPTAVLAKKGITKRSWLVYSPLNENANSKNDEIMQNPLAVLTFKSDGSFTEHILADKTKLPGRWDWNKKPETANGKKCINLNFHKMSNVSPSKKVFAAVDVDYEIVNCDYNFTGHDAKYTGFSHWIARITLNEMKGEWILSFDKTPAGWPDKGIKLTTGDNNHYSLESLNGNHKEDGTWSIINNYLEFHPASEKSIMNDFRLDAAYHNGKSRLIKFKSGETFIDGNLNEVITNDQVIGKWTLGEMEIEFTKTFKFKVSNPSNFEKYVEKQSPFDIYRWELKNNTISFYPTDENKCDKCKAVTKIILYDDGRELTFGDMVYDTGKFKKIQ